MYRKENSSKGNKAQRVTLQKRNYSVLLFVLLLLPLHCHHRSRSNNLTQIKINYNSREYIKRSKVKPTFPLYPNSSYFVQIFSYFVNVVIRHGVPIGNTIPCL